MLRVALQPSPEDSVTVAEAARRLGCDQTTVRELLRKGRLAGHMVGKGDRPTGVRVKLWSVIAYEERHAIGRREPERRKGRQRASTAAHREALAYLKSIGLDFG